jgi:hypothetical protein
MMSDDMANSTREVGGIYGRAISDAPKNFKAGKDSAQRYRLSEAEEGRRGAEEARASRRHETQMQKADREAREYERQQKWLDTPDEKTGATRRQQKYQSEFDSSRLGNELTRAQLDQVKSQQATAAQDRKMATLVDRFMVSKNPEQTAAEARSRGVSPQDIELAMGKANSKKANARMTQDLQDPLVQTQMAHTAKIQRNMNDLTNLASDISEYRSASNRYTPEGRAAANRVIETLKIRGMSEDQIKDVFSSQQEEFDLAFANIKRDTENQLLQLQAAARSTGSPVLQREAANLEQQLAEVNKIVGGSKPRLDQGGQFGGSVTKAALQGGGQPQQPGLQQPGLQQPQPAPQQPQPMPVNQSAPGPGNYTSRMRL